MVSADFDRVAIDLGLARHGDTLWGTCLGIPCLASLIGQQLAIKISFAGKYGAPRSAMVDFLKDLEQKGQISKSIWNLEGRLCTFFPSMQDGAAICSLVQKISAKASDFGFDTGCSQCGSPSASIPCVVENRVMHLCESCITKNSADAVDRKKPLRYLIGGIGALLGAILGSIAWIMIGIAGFYAAIGGLAIAWVSVQGYTLFKGPASLFRLPIIIFSILAALLFAEYAGLVIALLRDESIMASGMNLWKILQIIPTILSNPEVLREMLPNLGLGVLFAGLGAFGTLRQVASVEKASLVQRLDITNNP